jgi:osmoprotectant transport system permease protein
VAAFSGPEGGDVTLLAGTWAWLADPSHWSGPDGVPVRTLEHLQISALALALACAVALPVGVLLGHWGRGGAVAVNVGNVGRAIPTFGVLVILASWERVGVGNLAAVLALAVFAVPPLLTNAYVGMRAVEPDVREAARGMGMTGGQLLRRVELPLALPLLAAGFRTAAVQVVATATLAALVAGGGLGRFIVDGYGQQDQAMGFAGAVLVALLAIATELGLGLVERRVTPGARRRAARPTARAVQPATGS